MHTQTNSSRRKRAAQVALLDLVYGVTGFIGVACSSIQGDREFRAPNCRSERLMRTSRDALFNLRITFDDCHKERRF
jgi:hypothetical protein